MRFGLIRLLAFSFFAVLLSSRAYAGSPAVESRDYDLHAILFPIPDFDAVPTGIPQDAAKAKEVADLTKTRERMVDGLTRWIEQASLSDDQKISAAEREDHPGTFAIRATAAQHDRIVRMIDPLIARAGIQITVETRMYFLNDAAEAKLPASFREKLLASRAPSAHATAGVALDADDLAALSAFKTQDQGPDSTRVVAPRITIFNGQRATCTVGSDREFTSSYDRVVEAGQNKWLAKIQHLQLGISVDVRCRTDDQINIAMDLNVESNRLLDLKSEPFKDAGDQHLTVQVPMLDARKLHELLSVHSAGAMLFCVNPSPKVEMKEKLPMYVVVSATTQHH